MKLDPAIRPRLRLRLPGAAVRLTAAGAAAVGVLGLVSVAVAGPADASPQCTTARNVSTWDGAVVTVPVSSNGSDNCWLAKGNVGSAVRALQQAIRRCEGAEFANVSVDGDYGPQTKWAVTEIQQGVAAAGDPISIDGVYGPQTKGVMAFPVVGADYCDDAP